MGAMTTGSGRTGSRARRAVIAAAPLIATISAAGSQATAGGPTDRTAAIRILDVSATVGATTETYWTAERMTNAAPADVIVDTTRAHATDGPVGGAANSGADDAASSVRFPPKLAPTGAAALDPQPLAARVRRPYTNLPDRTVGKVFFTGTRGDQTCSAVALNSSNKSVVWTAGHCVEAGAGGGFHTNWVFVPAYGSCGGGCRPYGTFRATSLMTTTAWADAGDFRHDMGAAVVAPIGGRRLVSTVGGQGFAAGEPDGATFHDVGYPADPPFNGRRQLQCTGTSTGRDDGLGGSGAPPLALACDLTGGASGGPWLIDLGTNGYGYVNGANSYRYGADPRTLYSPYFGDEAVQLFVLASTAPIR
jgi:hypothetical protein